MQWRNVYLDLVLVPFGFFLTVAYHCWLWHKVQTEPLTTIIGTNSAARRKWVSAMMKDNDKKNIVAVQTLRNVIMGSSLMATTSVLLCSGLATVIGSTYSVNQPLNNGVYGARDGEFMVALKCVILLVIFLFAFLCHSLSIMFLNQVNFLINTPEDTKGIVSPDYVSELLEKGFTLNTVGNRLFYAALPLLLWILGPVLVFFCSVSMIPILYNLDFVTGNEKDSVGEKIKNMGDGETK